MNILFLDDDPIRRKRFLSENPTAYVVATAEACIDLLQPPNAWDLVSLDHDLSGEHWADPARKTPAVR